VPVALSVLAKPLPVKPPLSLSTVPSTPQKPRAFSWIVICVPPLDELLELLLEDELELLELLLDDELELLELPLEEPSPVQAVGTWNVPSWLPWNPNEVLAPAARLPFQLQQLLNDGDVVLAPATTTFQLAVTLAGSLNPTWTVQPLMEPGPVLVTVTSNW
jgi:hypothetical protein